MKTLPARTQALLQVKKKKNSKTENIYLVYFFA